VIDDFDPLRAVGAVRALGRETPVIPTATRRTPSVGAWLAWLEGELQAHRASRFGPGAPSTERRVRAATAVGAVG
jgi:hypothetical protein